MADAFEIRPARALPLATKPEEPAPAPPPPKGKRRAFPSGASQVVGGGYDAA
jgi:hypothetical protein